MNEYEQNMALLEERYATLRSDVRDKYAECRELTQSKMEYQTMIANLENHMTIFNRRKNRKQIKLLEMSILTCDVRLDKIKEELVPIANEMSLIEKRIGDRLEKLYGKDYMWWDRH